MRKRRIYFDGDRALIPLASARGVAVVDTDDVPLVCGRNWCLNRAGYAHSNIEGRNIHMQQVVMGHKPGLVIDHINGDKLDNRRCNLRHATHTENMRNARKQSGRSSKFKGVYLFKRLGNWLARITVSGKCKCLGYFANQEDAARAYDAAARQHFGEFAVLNFPESRNG